MADMAFIVTRIIKSSGGAAMELRMGVFVDQHAAETFVTAAANELRTIVEMQVSVAGQPITDMTLGSALQGLGIEAIQHKIEACEVTEGEKLVQAVPSGLILPVGMRN